MAPSGVGGKGGKGTGAPLEGLVQAEVAIPFSSLDFEEWQFPWNPPAGYVWACEQITQPNVDFQNPSLLGRLLDVSFKGTSFSFSGSLCQGTLTCVWVFP